ncbi:MAG: hypothetical protein CMIDDMOC_00550 [Sodalis sp. Fle]|nr:MAG: hypothetical protein CMIDDMOC_00550 [Sodalis sp. Fle]
MHHLHLAHRPNGKIAISSLVLGDTIDDHFNTFLSKLHLDLYKTAWRLSLENHATATH